MSHSADHIDSGIKHFMDWLSLSTVVTTLMGWLPALGAILPIVWYTIRIYETDTVKSALRRLRGKKDDDNK